jgi:hypothetical protein
MKARVAHLVACWCLLFVTVARSSEPEVAFLRERVSITKPSGIFGFAPGTRVVIVTRHGGLVTVESGDYRFDVSQDQLVSDPEAARMLASRDSAEQQAAQQQIVRQQEAARHAAPAPGLARPAAAPDSKAVQAEQLQMIRDHRGELEAELHRVDEERKGAGPTNATKHTWRYTRWGNRRDGYVRSIYTSPNAGQLEARAKELRQKIDDSRRREEDLIKQLK